MVKFFYSVNFYYKNGSGGFYHYNGIGTFNNEDIDPDEALTECLNNAKVRAKANSEHEIGIPVVLAFNRI